MTPGLVLIGGGARSGKSAFALAYARRLGPQRCFIATAQAFDAEMRTRIDRHRDERGADFDTVEEPVALAAALGRAPGDAVVLVDCLTLWLSNLLCADVSEGEILRRIDELVAAGRARRAPTLLVSNEVGLGLVPETPLGRAFRDLTGICHQRLAAVADEIYAALMGVVLRLHPAPVETVRLELAMGPAFALDFSLTEQLLMLGAAWLWDRFGEPPAAIHPVVWMGKVIGALTGRHRGSPSSDLVRGLFIALVVPGVFWFGTTCALLGLSDAPVLRFVVGVWLLKSSFALATLARAAQAVRRALDEGDLGTARVGLRSLCSRDPSELSEEQVAAGAIESVAENASDSVVAPLFFVIFGLPGALAYRAVNTADAMIGYRGSFEYVGKAVARLDDALNFVPARLTAWLLLLAGLLQGLPARSGFIVLLRDGGKTESPNAGRPMAVMAGLLGVRLEKPGHYALGDALQPLDGAMIRRSVRLLRWLGWMVLLLVAQSMVWLAR